MLDVVDFVFGASSAVSRLVLVVGAGEVVRRDVVADVAFCLRTAVDVDAAPDVRRGVVATERDRVGDEAVVAVGVETTAPGVSSAASSVAGQRLRNILRPFKSFLPRSWRHAV